MFISFLFSSTSIRNNNKTYTGLVSHIENIDYYNKSAKRQE